MQHPRTVQFVGISAFHTRISDPLIGGTYMTVRLGLVWAFSAFLIPNILFITAFEYFY